MNYKTLILLVLSVSLAVAQGRRGGGEMMTWDENLNLTTEQMQQITEIREAMQPAMREIRQNLRSLEIELRDLTRSGDADAAKVAELEASISEYQTSIETIMSGHQDQIRNLLTPDQQLIFDQREFGPREDRGSRNSRGGMRGGDQSGDRRGHGRGGSRW